MTALRPAENRDRVAGATAPGLHRAFVGADGGYRTGTLVLGFESRYADFAREPSTVKQFPLADRLEKFVHGEVLALFLCAPHALYMGVDHAFRRHPAPQAAGQQAG